MGGISSALELSDRMTPVLRNITDALNIMLSSMDNVQEATVGGFDIDAIAGARDAITDACAAMVEYGEEIEQARRRAQEITAPELSAAQGPIQWNTYNGVDVFAGNGAERFQQEIQRANSMLEQLSSTQAAITTQAQALEILPPEAVADVQQMQNRIEILQNSILQAENNSLNIGTEEANAQVERLRMQLDRVLNLQGNLSTAMQGADVGNINSAYLQLSRTIENMERSVRDSFSQPVEVPVVWHTDGLEVFTGMERFQREIQSANAMAEQLSSTQAAIVTQAQGLEILPPEAVTDIQQLQNRIEILQNSILQIENNPLSIGTEEASTQVERLRMQLNQVLNLQGNLSTAIQGADVSSINHAYLQFSRTVENIERSVRDSFSQPVEVPIIWHTDGLEVFAGSGMDRFQQEVQSANSMLEQLSSTQAAITAQAYNTSIFPPDAARNLNSLATRIDMVRSSIIRIENNPLNIGTDAANAELERMRAQMDQMLQIQNELKQAMQSGDISAVNSQYLRLSQIVSGMERHIRDNTDEQGRFNQEIQEGITHADGLTNMIKKAVAAYMSIQSVGKVLNISDELTQTTARINMMNQAFEDSSTSTEELMNLVYVAAQDARGSFADMASVVARFGNNARDAFDTPEEVIAFADLVQKQMTIAGTSTAEASNAMLQLSQALGSGVLRGDELNSIFEQAPNLIQNIADYLDVPIGEIREMASEGELSAGVVKAAIFEAGDEINEMFEDMPMTWGQVWNSMRNTALVAFQPVLQRINGTANSAGFQNFANGAIQAMAVVADIVLNIFDFMGEAGGFIADNWSIISPIIYGVAAALAVYYGWQLAANTIDAISNGLHIALAAVQMAHAAATGSLTAATMAEIAAQNGLNAALSVNPAMLVVIGMIALVAALFAVCNAIAKTTGIAESGFGIICGAVFTAGAFVLNSAIGVINAVIQVIWSFIGLFIGFIELFINVFSGGFDSFGDAVANLIGKIIGWFLSLGKVVTRIIDAIFGTDWTSGLSALQDDVLGWGKNDTAITLNRDAPVIDYRFNYGDAFATGAEWGDGIAEKVSNFSLLDLFDKAEIPNEEDYKDYFNNMDGYDDYLSNIADDTSSVADAVDITEEDLKYLKDIAEQEQINRFTTAEIKVDMGGITNQVNGNTDLDGMVDYLAYKLEETMSITAAGVH